MLRSRIVRWLRVLLPLAALAILSVLFLIARAPEPGGQIPYADPRLEDHARTPGITAPQFSTVTPGGATVTLTAARAVPDGTSERGGAASDVALAWRDRDGLTLTVGAGAAAVDGPHLSLSGDVEMQLSSGWRLSAPRLDADTDADLLTAPDAVAVTAPFGDVTAGGMQLSRGADGQPVLELNRGVRLIYRP